MSKQEKEHLEEYRVNIDMWKHHDNLRQDKNKSFLTANGFLVAALGILLKLGKTVPFTELSAVVVISVFGLIISFLWILLQARNAAYINFHRLQLRSLETEMQGWSTFDKQWDGIKSRKQVKFNGIPEKFEPRGFPKLSSHKIDRGLSIVATLFWAIIIVGLLLTKGCS